MVGPSASITIGCPSAATCTHPGTIPSETISAGPSRAAPAGPRGGIPRGRTPPPLPRPRTGSVARASAAKRSSCGPITTRTVATPGGGGASGAPTGGVAAAAASRSTAASPARSGRPSIPPMPAAMSVDARAQHQRDVDAPRDGHVGAAPRRAAPRSAARCPAAPAPPRPRGTGQAPRSARSSTAPRSAPATANCDGGQELAGRAPRPCTRCRPHPARCRRRRWPRASACASAGAAAAHSQAAQADPPHVLHRAQQPALEDLGSPDARAPARADAATATSSSSGTAVEAHARRREGSAPAARGAGSNGRDRGAADQVPAAGRGRRDRSPVWRPATPTAPGGDAHARRRPGAASPGSPASGPR